MGLFTKKKTNTIANVCNLNEQSIPVSVVNLVQYVEQNSLQLEGVYRISGPTKEIDSLCELMIKGKPIDWTKYTHYTIASALKKYLVQFDEPLIPFNNYESFLQVARKIATTSKTTTTNTNNILLSQSFAGMPSNSKATTPSGEFLSKKERIEEFRELLKAIPEQNYKVLKYILAHLTKVEQNASVNKMNSNNLAIVFGPICFRYKESSKNKDPMKILTDAPAISSCVHTFITDYEYIFAGKEFVDDPSPIIPVIDSLKALDEASAEGRRSKRSSVNTPTYHSRNVSTEPLSDQDDPSKKKNSLTINHFTSRGSRTNSRASCSMVDLPKVLSQTLEDGDSAMINNSIAPSVFDKLVAVDQQRQ